MTSPQTPERPNLEQLKKQAKSLLHSARAGDPAALARLRALPGLAPKTPEQLRTQAALHDAQSVLAREQGFPSWNALREHVEDAALTFAAAAVEFVRCATGGAGARAERLLARHPGIAHAGLAAELVLGDAPAVAARLQARPALAREAVPPQDWEPLLYVCHTGLAAGNEDRRAGLVAIARQLLALGANPDAEYHWHWHPELPRTALWGALCGTAHLPLAEALLEGGANPTDGVSLHICAGGGNLAALELLRRHRVDVNGRPGGLPPLVYILGWGREPAGPRWLLEHGADANLAWRESGDAPLHVAARRWDAAMAELLVRHGADPMGRRPDGTTPHTLAAIHGNPAVAEWLLAHGAVDELTPLDRYVAAAARGDAATAAALRQRDPALPGRLRPEHHLLLQRPAEAGEAAVLAVLLAGGFDPRVADRDGVTPLHRAAMAGQAAAVRVLLEHGAPVDALDGMFAGTPLLWAAEGWRHEPHAGSDHPGVARLLLAAGSSREWRPPASAPGVEGTKEVLASLLREAGSTG